MSKSDWKPVPLGRRLAGGQGIVTKVQHASDGRLGALKQLHEKHLNDTERRARMQQEVQALQRLGHDGVPRILEHNMEVAGDKGEPLYFVEEWVEGRTLLELCAGAPVDLATSVEITRELAQTVDECHASGVVHRDIKPDNVIVRSDPMSPVLVDFGIAFAAAKGAARPIETGLNRELGNRFLRLPDHAAGRVSRDTRSDVTQLVGILFYLVTSTYPRTLFDEHGLPPHEAMSERLPVTVREDGRWTRLKRVFEVGFQPVIDDRFQSCGQLIEYLVRVIDAAEPVVQDRLEQEVEEFRAWEEAATTRRQRAREEILVSVGDALLERLSELTVRAGFKVQRRGGVRMEAGRFREVIFGVRAEWAAGSSVNILHRLEFQDGEIVATFRFGEGPRVAYYRGPAMDVESLRESVLANAGEMLGQAVAHLRRLLEK